MHYGLGTTQFWHGSTEESRNVFRDALFSYDIHVIDTAEMYGHGRCEKEVRRILQQYGRENFYIIDKILPDNVTEKKFGQSLQRSLDLLATDHIDLYLLHWRENCSLELMVEKMEEARQAGIIGQWGVSNFDVADMEDLLRIKNGDRCYANQIFYNIFYRGVEFDLLPYLKERGILPISYSTLDTRENRKDLLKHKEIRELLEKDSISPEALMLAFATRNKDILALFNTSSVAHLKEDLQCLEVDIDKYMEFIDRYYPAPKKKVPMEKR